MRRSVLIAFSGISVLGAAILSPSTAEAQRVQRIAAIVNDDVVSQYDLQARMYLVISSSGLRPTPQLQQRLSQQVLRNLIDERLKLQEAKKKNISVSKRDMSSAISRVEKQNRIPAGSFNDFLKKNRLPRDSILSQMRAEIAWSKLIRRVLVPRITVGDDEVGETLQRLKERKGQMEYRVSEIFLTVDQPGQEQEIRRTAQRLIDELRRGAKFPSVAKQFSQSASASVGGDLGWLQDATMDVDFRKAVLQMKKTDVVGPIATPGGIQILYLSDSRRVLTSGPEDTVIQLQQILLPVRERAGSEEVAAQMNLAQILSETVSGCADHARAAVESGAVGSPKLGRLKMGNLAKNIQSAVAKLPVGKASAPIRTDRGVAVFMVCDRKEAEGNLPTRDQVAERLRRNRIGVLAKQYLRDLRAAAVVDLRV